MIGIRLFCLVFMLSVVNGSAQTPADTAGITPSKDSLRYTRLRERMKKHKFTGELYNLLFRDVYNKTSGGQASTIEDHPFKKYEGMTIGSITIKSLDVLGESVYDSTRKGKRLERFASKTFHINTRERIVRNSLLLFTEGDLINPTQLMDNERLLRQNPTILDARIIIIPRAGVPWLADLTVYIQDVWSLIPSGNFRGFSRFEIGLDNRNVQGLAHTNFSRIRWNSRDTLQKFQFRSIYAIPYIGRSFITGQVGFIWERDLKQQYIRFSRPFLTVNTRYAGAAESGHTNQREYKRFSSDLEKVVTYAVDYNYYDVWVGRAFKSPFGNESRREKSRFVLAFRANKFRYLQRPEVRLDTNQLYWNRSAYLLSLGFSNRDYQRDVLIYGFGRTEDVPIGTKVSVTMGTEHTEFGQRGYGGMQVASGRYLPKELGYVYGLINMGSFYQIGMPKQGVVSTQLSYFSPLMTFGLTKIRQFVNIRFVEGLRRDPVDYLNVSGDKGFRGVFSDQLIGNKWLTIGLETVVFSPGSILGFRSALFAFADLGKVTLHNRIWDSPWYQGYGLGIRLRNENLTFNTIQLRIGFFPNIIGVKNKLQFGLDGEVPLRLPDFDISAPEIIPLR